MRLTAEKSPMRTLTGRHVGIVRDLHVFTPEPGDARVWAVTAELSSTVPIWGVEIPQSGSGAGLSPDAAIDSAIGESAERYAAAGERLMETSLATPEEISEDRATWLQLIPCGWPKEPKGARWNWVKSGDGSSVPTALVFLPHARQEGEWIPFPSISTGLAAGSRPGMARDRAVLEVVERDAVARFWYGRGRFGFTRVDMMNVRAEVHDAFKDARWKVRLYTIDAVLGIPTAFVVAESRHANREIVSVGSASACDWSSAATKAMIEAAHGHMYVRQLLKRPCQISKKPPSNFEQHALWPSQDPGAWKSASAFLEGARLSDPAPPVPDAVSCLLSRESPIRFHLIDLTPSDLKSAGIDVVRAVSPDLLPLPGDDSLRPTSHPRWPSRASLFPHPMP